MPADLVTVPVLELPALIGKMPGHGDFISRGAAHSSRDAFDLWLSDWLALGRNMLGDGFRDTYESAAPWLWENSACTAILLPSRDSVGRLFPLLVVAEPNRSTQEVYDCSITAIAEGHNADSLRGELDAFASATRQPQADGWFLPDGATADLPAPDQPGSWKAVEAWLR